MLPWGRANSRYQTLSSRHQATPPPPTRQTSSPPAAFPLPHNNAVDAFPPDVVAVAFWVEQVIRVIFIYQVLLRIWKLRFFFLIAIGFYGYLLYSRGDLTRETLTHHGAFGQLIWRQLTGSGHWLHILSLFLTDFGLSIGRRWMEYLRSPPGPPLQPSSEGNRQPSSGSHRRHRHRHTPRDNEEDMSFGAIWNRFSGGIEALFASRRHRRDEFGLLPVPDRDDWVDDAERQAFTQFLLEKYRQSTETELRLDCPITKELMRYPVVAADGFTYEANAIKRWMRLAKDAPRSPITGEILAHTNLVPNHTLKSIIESHKEEFREQRRRRQTTRSAGSPTSTW